MYLLFFALGALVASNSEALRKLLNFGELLPGIMRGLYWKEDRRKKKEDQEIRGKSGRK